MTVTIDLAPEEEAYLREMAAQGGQEAETVAAALLRASLRPSNRQAEQVTPSQEETLADFWSGYIGIIHGSSEPWSEGCGEKFTDYLVEKKKQDHL